MLSNCTQNCNRFNSAVSSHIAGARSMCRRGLDAGSPQLALPCALRVPVMSYSPSRTGCGLGSRLVAVCVGCLSVLVPEARFCPQCGLQAPKPRQRIGPGSEIELGDVGMCVLGHAIGG